MPSRLSAIDFPAMTVRRRGADLVYGSASRPQKVPESIREPASGPIAATVESLKRDPRFVRWFGGSVVVWPTGNPKVVFHGTAKDFETFDSSKLALNTLISTSLIGIYFTESPQTASMYTAKGFEVARGPREGARIWPAFLRIEKPYELSERGYWRLSRMKPAEISAFRLKLMLSGYDGLMMPSVWRGAGSGVDYAVFEPAQIWPVLRGSPLSGMASSWRPPWVR